MGGCGEDGLEWTGAWGVGLIASRGGYLYKGFCYKGGLCHMREGGRVWVQGCYE